MAISGFQADPYDRLSHQRGDYPTEYSLPINPGDVVVLKSGSPMMTVCKIASDSAEVVWSVDGNVFHNDFPLIVLKRTR